MGKRRRVEVEAVSAEAPGQPFVCYFPTGAPQDADKDLEFSVFARNQGGRAAQQHVLVGSSDRIDYVGMTAGPEYSGPQPCSFAVGVYDKSSGKLQLLPIQGGKVCRMEPRVHGLDYGPSGLTAAEATTREEKLALNKRLVGSFGSTRRRRQLDAREEGIVRQEKIGDAQVLTDLLRKQAGEAEKQGITKEQVYQRATAVRNLPPHHPEASVPALAYRLEEIIPPGAVDSLDKDALRLLKVAEGGEALQKAKEKATVPAYLLGRMQLLTEPDKTKVKQRARTMAFLSQLLGLLNRSSTIRVEADRGGMTAVAQRMRIHEPLLLELLELFYNRRLEGNVEVYEQPRDKKELLLAYVMVLAQLLEGGGLAAAQFEALRHELKMKSNDLVTRFREVGSTCVATTFRPEDADGSTGASQRSYNVIMLKDGKTLGESFPGIKIGPKRK